MDKKEQLMNEANVLEERLRKDLPKLSISKKIDNDNILFSIGLYTCNSNVLNANDIQTLMIELKFSYRDIYLGEIDHKYKMLLVQTKQALINLLGLN